MIYQLTYRSTSINTINTTDLESIHSLADKKNKKLNITGCLVFYNTKFYQLLEGDEQDVISLYNEIKRDHRHTKIELIAEGLTKNRIFPNWGMAYYPIAENRCNKSEFKQFKSNLLLLTKLTTSVTKTELNFWKQIKKALSF
ncbi:BLUF domain-containing protein [Cellulophaga sp. F20128]|uniref:BLUF domain-containing protein n=1 Tax=Cellulophaga sp. F20128 TaxID=2926413 RepID=UPI001FF632A4|nr:BLUF domain-containing protein [Cellulophaga sp. F20128]MCK0156561.1 BLUF domain-containing protein [Cellulophaga sp. F20128]